MCYLRSSVIILTVFFQLLVKQANPALSYDALFPALPESATPVASNPQSTTSMRVGSSVVTQVYNI